LYRRISTPLVRQSEAKASLACPEDVMGDGLVLALEVLLKTDGGGDGVRYVNCSEGAVETG
jgi:hypothetical protein